MTDPGNVAQRRRYIPYSDDGPADARDWDRFEDALKAGRLAARRFYLDTSVSAELARDRFGLHARAQREQQHPSSLHALTISPISRR